ncbi:putative inner membrane protein [Rubripirellula lacrimiformis]|uniref:Putative inner membrane protein n=1 Tax=Rubripirellula lacrimiformis TaxID=1930273 RepID=A0A517NJF3_9BACT|nr:AI-2E family transporter [Rubripirellula lacrimiformis]QDT07259.1 putative inner membrane protein [Rubripirellula lacrimiformis]
MTNRRRKSKSDRQPNSSGRQPNSGGEAKGSDPAAPQSPETQQAETQQAETQPLTKDPTSPTDSGQAAGTASRDPGLPSLARILSVVMLILGIIAVGALFYKVMAGFFVPLFLAALLVVIFRPVHHWIFQHTGRKPRTAALATTSLVLAIVLMPLILIVSVATSQFTAMVSQVNFKDLTEALDRGREQLGISLPHAEQFRRLDELSDSLDQGEDPKQVLSDVKEAYTLVEYLQSEVAGPVTAEPFAEVAKDRLDEFAGSVQTKHDVESPEGLVSQLDAEEEFHQGSLKATAAIRTWMKAKLGGTFTSQVRLLANPSAEDLKKLLQRARETLQPRFVSITSATGSYLIQVLVGLAVLVIAVYFFLIDGAAMIRTLMRLSPLDDKYEAQLLLEFDRTSRAVVLASVLSALVQGVLAAIAFWFFGFESIILLFLITSMMALVPFLGAASVWVPCAIYLGAVEQRWTAAAILAIYGATVVSSIDNVIKMYVLHGRSTLHPLFALLSVLGGVKVFGPIGILVGPMVVVFLQTLLEILNHELAGRDARAAIESGSGLDPEADVFEAAENQTRTD